MTTTGSPDLSSTFSRGLSANGSATTPPSAKRAAIRQITTPFERQEDDVRRGDGHEATQSRRPRRPRGVELEDAKARGPRRDAVLRELAQVRRADDGDGERVRTSRWLAVRREREALGSNRAPYLGADLRCECRRCRRELARGRPDAHLARLHALHRR